MLNLDKFYRITFQSWEVWTMQNVTAIQATRFDIDGLLIDSELLWLQGKKISLLLQG